MYAQDGRLTHGRRQAEHFDARPRGRLVGCVWKSAAHIHAAPATAPGPVVVPLTPYSGGCTDVTRELAKALIQDPGSYYVNVHNGSFPAGALLAQLNS